MNSIFNRLKNAYRTGRVKEVLRKVFWKSIYTINGIKERNIVKRAKLEYGLCQPNTRPFEVVVSLTTYPKRFQCIEMCLKSLICQSVKPNKIVVYLGKDSIETKIPEDMKKFEKYGVGFKIDKDDDLRSHKKYYYAMKDY